MRPLKFVKYLPDFEIQPIVFCPQNAAWKAYDYQNLELPFLKTITTYRCGIRRLQRYYHLRYTKGIRRHPYYYLLALKYIYFLDYFSAWYFECRKKALEIAKKEKVGCVFTTSPPHSVHLFGHHLKNKLGIPWVMDIRDALFDEPNRNQSAGVRFQAALEQFYEKRFYAAADAIISVSDPIIESIQRRHAALYPENRTYTIPNGFDDEDFSNSGKKANSDRLLTVTYTGSFMGKRNPVIFLKAIQILVESKDVKATDILIRFIGHFDNSTLELFKKFSTYLPIEVLPFLPHTETLRYQISSDLLLLIVNVDASEGGSQIMTGKFFEYIGSRRPIFALVPDGPLKQIIERGRFGYTVPQKDVSAIAGTFKEIYEQWKIHQCIDYKPDLAQREQYSRRNLTSKLAAIINEL